MSGDAKRPAGSSTAGEPFFLAVGRVRRPHGVSGETLVEVYTDFPERLHPKTVLYVGEKHRPLTIHSRRSCKDGLLLAFDGFNTPEEVGRYRNEILYVKTVERPVLPKGEYYHHQLLGINVEDENGRRLGQLTEILLTGANDVYVVTNASGNELLLPAISETVLEVDLAAKIMRVHLLPGLVEPEQEDT